MEAFKFQHQSAIVGIVLNPDPLRFTGKYVRYGGSKLRETLREQMSTFKTTTELSEFLCSHHWLVLTDSDWSKTPMDMRDLVGHKMNARKRAPVYLGDTVDVLGGEKDVERFTEKDNLWFVEYLYLVHIPENVIGVYRQMKEEEWSMVDLIPTELPQI